MGNNLPLMSSDSSIDYQKLNKIKLSGESNKYSRIGTSSSRITALFSPSVQSFLDEEMHYTPNGGPREQQEFFFNCELAKKYPLHVAAMTGDVLEVRRLIQKEGIDPNIKCKELYDRQPASFAARFGQLKAFIALMQVLPSLRFYFLHVPKRIVTEFEL
jgi:hypothetical protein